MPKPRIGKMRRKYVKGQFQKMMEGDLVSDVEKEGFQHKALEGAQAGIGAQQQMLNRAALSQTGGGSALTGELQKGTAKLGEAQAGAAVKASSAAKQLESSLRDQRAGQAMAAGERLIASNKEDVSKVVDTAMKGAEIAAQVASPSDIRLKTSIRTAGTSPSGIPLYTFAYRDDDATRYHGVMAQDLLKTHPQAVVTDERGYYRVYYGLIDADFYTV